MSSIGGLPPKPLPPEEKPIPENATKEQRQEIESQNVTARLEYQEQSQHYWFSVNQVQNMANQQSMQESNMQKSEHDALMEVARNLK